jgi:hypothetical protein
MEVEVNTSGGTRCASGLPEASPRRIGDFASRSRKDADDGELVAKERRRLPVRCTREKGEVENEGENERAGKSRKEEEREETSEETHTCYARNARCTPASPLRAEAG